MAYRHVTAEELLERMKETAAESGPCVVDVREDEEWAYYRLAHTLHIPMREIPQKLQDLPKDRPIYVVCAHGMRSQRVCDYLDSEGLEQVYNVRGGMAALARLQGFPYD